MFQIIYFKIWKKYNCVWYVYVFFFFLSDEKNTILFRDGEKEYTSNLGDFPFLLRHPCFDSLLSEDSWSWLPDKVLATWQTTSVPEN